MGLYSNHDGFVLQSLWVCTPIIMGLYSNDNGFVQLQKKTIIQIKTKTRFDIDLFMYDRFT